MFKHFAVHITQFVMQNVFLHEIIFQYCYFYLNKDLNTFSFTDPLLLQSLPVIKQKMHIFVYALPVSTYTILKK